MALPLMWAGLEQAEVDAKLFGRTRAAPERLYSGASEAELDLLRPYPGGPRIFVQVTLPDGLPGLFMIDTGADVSVLTDEAAERLGLDATREVAVWGLSGSASVHAVLLPEIRLGGIVVPDVDVLVGVPGFQNRAGYMPIDGLLGNNVWSRFTVEIDYPADTLVLHPPEFRAPGRRSAPMFFDGSHIHTLVGVVPEGGDAEIPVIAQVDTGASELTLCAATGLPFAQGYTQGLETVRGIGASETLPPFRFLEMTRRIPVDHVRMGGTDVQVDLPARWVAYEDTRRDTCGDGEMRALIGHEYLADHRVVFDYAGGRIALLDSRRPARQLDGNSVLLGQEVLENGRPLERGLFRAKLLLGSGEDTRAMDELAQFVAAPGLPDHAEAQVLYAQLLRTLGRHDEAWAATDGLSPGDLVDQEQIVGTVNGLLFEQRATDALDLAQRAVAERPDDGWAHVALADVQLALGRFDDAQQELLAAAKIEQYPDAHLLRRARVALAAGDRYGAMAHIRKLLALYPGGGPYLWFYAMLVDEPGERDTFRADVDEAMSRLHPHNRPFDFLVAAHRALGDEAETDSELAVGLKEHCEPMGEGPERDNCEAWYFALASTRLDDALERVDRALAATGERPDFLDTKAMVHLSRGEFDAALTAANRAARLSPDDVYMLWQAERIAQIARQESATR